MTVLAVISGQGKTKGKHEYSSMTLRKYTFLLLEGSGPLKSMFNLSNVWVDLIRKLLATDLAGISHPFDIFN